MKNLDRQILGIRTGSSSAYISWQLLNNESPETRFNLYKISGNGIPLKLNSAPIEGITFYQDDHVDFSVNTFYFVRAVVADKEQPASKWCPLLKRAPLEKKIPAPVKNRNRQFVPVGEK